MEFDKAMRTTFKDIDVFDYFDNICPQCSSRDLIIRSSRIRNVQDMGTPLEKVVARVRMVNFECKVCNFKFSPEHPLYPSKFEYSKAIIEYALFRYHYQSVSGNQIAIDLRFLHQVDIPEATIYSWLQQYSPDFIKARLGRDPNDLPPNIKAITVDGSYVSTGKDVIGKKNHVESLSVTRLEDGRYLLMWWE